MHGKRICLIGTFPPYIGGIPQHNYCLAKELLKSHKTLFIGYKNFYPEFLFKKNKIDKNFEINSDAEFFNRIQNLFSPYDPFTWIKTLKEIKKFNPDIIILPWWFIYLAPAYLFLMKNFNRNGFKTVILCHNVFEQADINYLKSLTKFIVPFKNSLIKQVFKQAKFFIVPSNTEKQEILSFHKTARIKKQLHPVYKFGNNNVSLNKQNQLKLLFFGFVKPYKGLDLLLNALTYLKDAPIFLTVAGKFFDNKAFYQEIIEKNNLANKVKLIDKYVANNEIGKYFSETDVVVLPYRSGTSSGITATAYGYKKPVLITDIGGLPDATENGQTGKIVEPENPKALAEGIIWFLENKNINFESNIEKFIENNMSWASMAKNIIKFTEGDLHKKQ